MADVCLTFLVVRYKLVDSVFCALVKVDPRIIWDLHKKHNELVSQRYGSMGNSASAKAKFSKEAMWSLLGLLRNSRSYDIYDDYSSLVEQKDIAFYSKHTRQELTEIDNQYKKIWLIDSTSAEFQPIVNEIKRYFQGYISSPFSIVNVVAKLYPSIKSQSLRSHDYAPAGAYKIHLDGYPEGLFKVLIYPNFLARESGSIYIYPRKIDRNPLTSIKGYSFASDDPPKYPESHELSLENCVITDYFGTGVCFDNSRTFHSALAGTSIDRIHLEMTLMRTLLPMPQQINSSFFLRHFIDPTYAYNSKF